MAIFVYISLFVKCEKFVFLFFGGTKMYLRWPILNSAMHWMALTTVSFGTSCSGCSPPIGRWVAQMLFLEPLVSLESLHTASPQQRPIKIRLRILSFRHPRKRSSRLNGLYNAPPLPPSCRGDLAHEALRIGHWSPTQSPILLDVDDALSAALMVSSERDLGVTTNPRLPHCEVHSTQPATSSFSSNGHYPTCPMYQSLVRLCLSTAVHVWKWTTSIWSAFNVSRESAFQTLVVRLQQWISLRSSNNATAHAMPLPTGSSRLHTGLFLHGHLIKVTCPHSSASKDVHAPSFSNDLPTFIVTALFPTYSGPSWKRHGLPSIPQNSKSPVPCTSVHRLFDCFVLFLVLVLKALVATFGQ